MGFLPKSFMKDEFSKLATKISRKRRKTNREYSSHMFFASFNGGYTKLCCIFKSKTIGLDIMRMLDETLHFVKLDKGNEMDQKLRYETTNLGDYEDPKTKFKFDRIKGKGDIDKEIIGVSGYLFENVSRSYSNIAFAFSDDIREKLKNQK